MADYRKSKVLDWWRDKEFNEYISIIERNGKWILVSTKVV